MNKRRSESEALAKEFSTPARQLKSIQKGAKIAEPLVFSEKTLFHQFTELKLHSKINAIIQEAIDSKTDVDIADAISQAAQDLGLKREWVERYFESTRYALWVADRTKEIEAHRGLSIEYLAWKHRENLEGRLKLTSGQLDSAKELGDRIWPKVSKIEHEISQKDHVTLDDLPDYQKKVDELETQFKAIIPLNESPAGDDTKMAG